MDVTCLGEMLIVLTQSAAEPLERTTTFTRSLGGSELNTAIALAEQGASVGLATVVGDDGFGRYAADTAASRGIDTSGVVVDDEHATGLYVKELGDGDASRMHYFRAASAGSLLSPAIIRRPAIESLLESTRVIHTTGITAALSKGAHDAISLVALERGERLMSFDVSWRSALWRSRHDEASEVLGTFVSTADIVFMTSQDAVRAFGTDDPAALRSLFPEPRWLMITGSESVTAFEGDERLDVPRPRQTGVDAIGASDAFSGGVLASLLRGESTASAVGVGLLLATRASATTSDHLLPAS
ncbi:sugar kinase [Microbacterium sp. MPKO10]|uniref:sugar kinase n=1 Tax=Microbacterium sp. MPKO10 TaxID=2989818 RepID=UPI002236422A|nr:sugar kinase [Microbacterium sp. MPKO10]MCW4456746.1 sugar kinase [Microbacterium sp. MPKO10]